MYNYYNNLLVAITCTPSLRPNERYDDHTARVITIHLTMSRDLKTPYKYQTANRNIPKTNIILIIIYQIITNMIATVKHSKSINPDFGLHLETIEG